MKRLILAVTGFLLVLYLNATPAATPTTQAQSLGATANEPGNMRAASSSKGEAAKARPKTPGEVLAQNKKLSNRLSTILRQQNPPVTDLQAASQGFRNLSLFVAAVHVSQNLGIPFDQLKTQEQSSGSLSKAIHVLKPDADANAQIWLAAEQTVDDLQTSGPVS